MTKKEQMINIIINDFSLSEQERILKSKRNEMDEDYLERLEKKLYNSSEKVLKNYLNSQ